MFDFMVYWTIGTLIIAVCIMVWFVKRGQYIEKRSKGISPSKTENHLMEIQTISHSGYTTHAYEVTRDPQKYTQIFAPKNRNK